MKRWIDSKSGYYYFGSIGITYLHSSSPVHDPAHDPERRMPRATRGPDENFLPKSAVTGSSRNEVHTSSHTIPPSQDRTIDNRGTSDRLYPWHEEDHSDPPPPYYTGNRLETVMDRMEQAMHRHPLPYRPKAVNQSPTELESQPTHSAADRNQTHWNES